MRGAAHSLFPLEWPRRRPLAAFSPSSGPGPLRLSEASHPGRRPAPPGLPLTAGFHLIRRDNRPRLLELPKVVLDVPLLRMAICPIAVWASVRPLGELLRAIADPIPQALQLGSRQRLPPASFRLKVDRPTRNESAPRCCHRILAAGMPHLLHLRKVACEDAWLFGACLHGPA